MSKTAKLFWSGRSQAVRLPKEFRMEGNEVRIRKRGAAVVLEPHRLGLGVARRDRGRVLGRLLRRREMPA